MDALRRRLMLRESERWAKAASALSGVDGLSDAAYILRLLSFELLLKMLVEEHAGVSAPKHHRFEALFELLPDPVRERLLELAGERIGPSALADSPIVVLKELGENFAALRYPWERYKGLSEQQYAALGPAWVAQGSPLGAAVFRYHPEELYGLTHAAKTLAGC